jgi:tetratricopeptide (TPR) repeat protein
VLSHPLFAEVVTATSRGRAQADRAKAAGRLGDLDGGQYLLVATCLALEAGKTPSATQLAKAVGYAHSVGDHAAAARLATHAADQGSGFEAVLTLACALSALGDIAESAAAFQKAEVCAHTPTERALLAARHGQHIAYRLGDPAAALAHIASVNDTIDDAGRALLAPDLAKWWIMAGDVTTTRTTPASTENPLAAFTNALGAAMFATMSADSPAARRALVDGRALQHAAQDAVPFASSLLDLSEFLVLVAEGRADLATVFAQACRARPPVDAAGQWSYALAMLLAQGGETSSAAELATLAVQQLRWRDFTGLLGTAIALRATLLAQAGNSGAATSTLNSLTTAQLGDIKVQLQSAEALLWLARGTDGESEAALVLYSTPSRPSSCSMTSWRQWHLVFSLARVVSTSLSGRFATPLTTVAAHSSGLLPLKRRYSKTGSSRQLDLSARN